jgi:hypothetical protein
MEMEEVDMAAGLLHIHPELLGRLHGSCRDVVI